MVYGTCIKPANGIWYMCIKPTSARLSADLNLLASRACSKEGKGSASSGSGSRSVSVSGSGSGGGGGGSGSVSVSISISISISIIRL
jgi:uncharacterized membrane protein YgcG